MLAIVPPKNHCTIVRLKASNLINDYGFENLVKFHVSELNRMLLHADVCYSFVFDPYWKYISHHDSIQFNVTRFVDDFIESPVYYEDIENCAITNVHVTYPTHKLTTNDLKFSTKSTLAHAFLYGDVHINRRVPWTIPSINKTVLFRIAPPRRLKNLPDYASSYQITLDHTLPHELLHTIGLKHSTNPNSIMYLFHNNNFALTKYTFMENEINYLHMAYGIASNGQCNRKLSFI